MLEPFLRLFPSDKPVAPFMYQELEKNDVWIYAKVYQARYFRFKQSSAKTDETWSKQQ